MPASELMEWSGRLSRNPWGRHRTEALHIQALMYMVAGPNHGNPGKLLDQIRLPWEKRKADVQVISGEQMAAFLIGIGGQACGE